MARRRRAERNWIGRLRQRFLTGLVIVLPMVITVWLLGVLFRIVHGISTPTILRILTAFRVPLVDDPAFANYMAPLIGLLTTLTFILLVGVLATNFLGRQFVEGFDRLMLRIPLIKGIYGGARQLLNAFSKPTSEFQRVVAVEYPRPGVYTIGFVTKEGVTLRSAGDKKMPGHTLVFLPTTPNPTSGWLAALPEEDVIPLDLTIEDGVKLIVSGGLVTPPGWGR